MKSKICIIDNAKVDLTTQGEFFEFMNKENYPRIDTNAKDFDASQIPSGPIWADYPSNRNLGLLRRVLQVPSPAVVSIARKFISLCDENSCEYVLDRLSITKCYGTVPPHVDSYRPSVIVWYPFPTHGSVLRLGNINYYPQEGDLVWLESSIIHTSIHYTHDPIYIYSLST